jgi:ATP-binding protein involved in chromosome partitioning
MADELTTKIQEALGTVVVPELERDLIGLGMVDEIRVENGSARLRLDPVTPACPLKAGLEKSVRAALLALEGVDRVEIDWTTEVPRTVYGAEKLVPGVRNIVVVGSGKGGVGKSTVAGNLALSLGAEGARVGLMDADIYGPNQPTMLGVSGEPRGEGTKIKPFYGPNGLKLISIGFFVKSSEPVIWRGPMLHGAVQQFLGDVAWGDLDYLIVDLPPGTGDVQLTLSQTIPVSGAVMVTTPQAVSLEDMKKAAIAMNRVNIPILGIVENMSGYTCRHCGETEYLFGKGGGKRVAAEFEVPFLGEIPMDPRVMVGGDDGKPVVVHEPESPAARALRRVARAMAVQVRIAAREAGGAAHSSPPRMPQPLPSS